MILDRKTAGVWQAQHQRRRIQKGAGAGSIEGKVLEYRIPLAKNPPWQGHGSGYSLREIPLHPPMNPLSYGLLRHVGAFPLADMSASGKAATCSAHDPQIVKIPRRSHAVRKGWRSPNRHANEKSMKSGFLTSLASHGHGDSEIATPCFSLAWLLLSLLLLLTTGLRAEFEPPLIKVMEKADIFGTEPFEGDVSVNAQGRWIAASQNGVFLSSPGGGGWQEVLTATGGKIVNSNTIKIHCRISDAGNWVVINRSGIYKSSDADPYVADTVTNTIGINNAYDLDMAPNGKWIASSSQGTLRYLNDGTPASLVLSSGSVGNGSLSTRRIVKINSNGDWLIMTTSGVYKNGAPQITNPSGSNIGGNIAYWSLDMNEQGDWVAISSRGTFLNATRISVAPNPDSSTTIEANDVGEMLVKITDQNLSNEFIWMAISPRGIYRNGERVPDISFLSGQTQYTLDMNNSGAWVASSETTALLNGMPINSDGSQIQTNNGIDNELLCKINDFSDYVCLTNSGVFRNEDRGLSNAKLALDNSQFTSTAFKHVLQLGTNGAVALLSEYTSITDRTGVYWGMNVLIPAPPQPTAATLSGTFIDWTDGGGSTAGYLISVGTNPQPASASTGNTLYIGTNSEFNIVNFSDFTPGVVNYIALAAINSEGVESPPIMFPYPIAPFAVSAQSFDTANQQVTLTWSSLPGKSYRIEKSLHLADDWQPLTEIPPSNAATSGAGINPPEWTMTRTFSDPTMTTKGFYRVKTPP